MSLTLRCLAALLLLAVLAVETRADAGPGCLFPFVRRDPRPWERVQHPSPEHDLVIVRDASVKEAELRIPRALMVAAAAPPVSTRHAMAGLALSTAFVGGGLWCMRYRAGQIPKKKVLAAVAVGFVLLSLLTTIDFADATPPRKAPLLPPGPARLGEINVTVVIVEQGSTVELVVPPEIADKISEQ